MTAPFPSRVANPPLPQGEGRGEGVPARADHGFTLIELLVTISIIVVLVALFGGAIAAARNGALANTTTNSVARLDQIVSTQFRRYESVSVSQLIVTGVRQMLGTSGTNASAARAWHVRRNLITADMPDRWADVQFMATGTAYRVTVSGSVTADVLGGVYRVNPPTFAGSGTAATTTFDVRFPLTAAQASYIARWNAANPKPTDQFGGAECLFMIIMQGGFADCLDCNGLKQLKKGDKDGDGAIEFWDEWNNPIDYILWAPGFRSSGETTAFFSPQEAPFLGGSVRPGLGMRPLIYSAGPDGQYGLNRNAGAANDPTTNVSNLGTTSSPAGSSYTGSGSVLGAPIGSGSAREDNIVNVELRSAP